MAMADRFVDTGAIAAEATHLLALNWPLCMVRFHFRQNTNLQMLILKRVVVQIPVFLDFTFMGVIS